MLLRSEDEKGVYYLDSRLSTACRLGNLKTVKKLAEQGVKIETRYDTAINVASEFGQLEIVKYLVSINAELETSGARVPPLYTACKYGHLNIVKYLHGVGVDMTCKGSYFNPFMRVCKHGHLEIVKYLVSIGIGSSDKYGTAIRVACIKCRFKIVKYLVSIGGDCRPTLESAAVHGNFDTVKFLVSIGVDLKHDGEKYLRLASVYNHLDIVKYLVSLDINVTDKIVKHTRANGRAEILKYYVDIGTDVGCIDVDEWLTEACYSGSLSTVKFFVSIGANIHWSDENAVGMASKEGYPKIVKYLVDQGADITAKDNWAFRRSDVKVRECLINAVLNQMKRFTLFSLLNKIIVKDLVGKLGLYKWVEHYPYYQVCKTLFKKLKKVNISDVYSK